MDPIRDIPNITTGGFGIPNINVRQHSINIGGIWVRKPAVREIGINNIADRSWMMNAPTAIAPDVPVTEIIGTPIVNMPGCVKVNKENAKNPTNKNKMLVNDDPKQNVVLCDAGMPYYEPPNYDYRELTWQTINTNEEEVDEGVDVDEPPAPDLDTPEPPVTPPTGSTEIECPEPNAQRIGDLSQSGKERVKGYKLSVDKKVCIKEWEDVPFVDAYLPSASIVTTTAGIAAVATTSALLAKPLADLLLKVVKPVIKKVITKVKGMLGKKPPVLSLRERLLKQREANAALKAARKLKGG
tara:strand:- start:1387 stop:2280 length:894 start_codon:yes stop_codon:yes gene_type:complete